MLTETSIIDKIEVLPEIGAVHVRRADRVLRDGEKIAETYHRHVLEPGADLTGQHPLVVAIARAAWAALPKTG